MQQKILFLTRIAMGWIMLYAGITKILNPNWSAAGYLGNAKTFTEFYAWFLRPEMLPFTNFINEWGLTLLGISLITGAFVRFSGFLGALLMMLYYFPVLNFPKIGANAYIVDDHIIYALVLLYFAVVNAGESWGLDAWWKNRKK